MTLDHKCVRDLLLTLEETMEVNESGLLKDYGLKYVYEHERMKNYSRAEIHYALQQLHDAKPQLVSLNIKVAGDKAYFLFSPQSGITFEGHQYLNAIRSDTVWAKVLKQLEKVGNAAPLSIVYSLAEALLKSQLGL